MKTQDKFWWFVAVAISATAIVLLTIAVLFWQNLSDPQQSTLLTIFREKAAYFFTFVVLIFTAFGFTLDWFFRFYIIPVNQLAEQTRLIHSVNPVLRTHVDGSYDVMRLAEIINQIADRQEGFRQQVEEQLSAARDELEAEKNILAALLEDLPQGILICNLQGQIVFYNRKIKILLAGENTAAEHSGAEDHPWIGLDRSVFQFIDRFLVESALKRMGKRLESGHEPISERFLLDTPKTCMLPAEIVPVVDRQMRINGCIIFIEDRMAQLQREKEKALYLQTWRHRLIQSISAIKAVAEILSTESVGRADENLGQMIKLLDRETASAADLMKQSDRLMEWTSKPPWPLTTVDAAEWGRLFQERVRETLDCALELAIVEPLSNISIDMHHLTTAVLYILYRLQLQIKASDMRLRIFQEKKWLHLHYSWQGEALDQSMLDQWKEDVPVFKGVGLANSVEEVLEFHGASLWVFQPLTGHSAGPPSQRTGLVLLLPVLEEMQTLSSTRRAAMLSDSRPEFYDFDLFNQVRHSPDLAGRNLPDLTYTVFDTETTGLDPYGGDEIISIAAVRIVNGRLLREERFNQLVNPNRPVPWDSIKIHGIRPEMLISQPSLAEVVPRFHDFCKDTVLVGHNVAFDLRMLQMKEDQTHTRFDQPVLDTLLLSAIVHPAHTNHSLDTVANRLGVAIVGRHTAIGDAIMTGEIFLKILPLLAEKKIHTLAQARQASEKTYYARLKY